MKHLISAVLFCLILVPVAFAQNPDADAAANSVTVNAVNDRMRGQQVRMQDHQGIATPTGRNLNVHDIAVKTKELNDVVHSVNLDVINMNKGILAADLSEKLKKIEKLSKELRRSLE